MHPDEKRAFGDALRRLFAVYGEPVTVALLDAWFEDFEQYPLAVVEAAMRCHRADPAAGMFKPTPAHLMKHLQGTPDERSARAWSKVLQGIRRAGANYTVVFDDALIHAAIDSMGGWPTLAHTTTHELVHAERRFRSFYAAYAQPGRSAPPYPARLVGLLDAGGGSHGSFNSLRYLGDEHACIAVERGGHYNAVRVEGPQPFGPHLIGPPGRT